MYRTYTYTTRCVKDSAHEMVYNQQKKKKLNILLGRIGKQHSIEYYMVCATSNDGAAFGRRIS